MESNIADDYIYKKELIETLRRLGLYKDEELLIINPMSGQPTKIFMSPQAIKALKCTLEMEETKEEEKNEGQ